MSDTQASTEKADFEKGHGNVQVNEANAAVAGAEGTVHRNLKSRHLQMIALGGTIGTGLFVGSGATLANGGPLGMVLGYSILGVVIYTMMIALGEMTTLYPVSGAFIHYAARFLDPAVGFALGWNYWYSYAITLPTEITAAALVIDFWPGAQGINSGAWIAVMLVVICSFNFLGVRYYGEAEFWFSIIKIVTLLGLIILGIVITCGGGPNHETIGFRYWRNPGPFQQENGIPGSAGRFLAFWTTLENAAFSFLGTEIVALTAAEAENPRRNVPRAIKRVFYRIVFFYVAGTFVMGLIVSPDNDQLLNGSGTNASPWVIAIQNAGIKGLPSVINAVVLISAFSAGNSDLYASSRTLYGLALDGKTPRLFKKVTKRGLPIWCLALTASIGLLGFMVSGSTSASTAFSYLSNLSTITGVITWSCILGSYLRFYYGCKLQGVDRSEFPYQAPCQPYASWFGLVMCLLIILFNGYTVFLAGNWSAANFVVDYVTIPIFVVLYAFWKIWKRTSYVRLADIDFVTGRRELDAISDEYDTAEATKGPQSFVMRAWTAIM